MIGKVPDGWRVDKFKNIFEFQKKSKIMASEGLNVGNYPFYTSSKILKKYINHNNFNIGKALIFGTGGLASIHYATGKFSTSTDCFTVNTNREDIEVKYVYSYLMGNIHILENGFQGAGLKHISKKYMENIDIPIPPLPQQENIVKVLDISSALVEKQKELLKKYDLFLKSKFIEMFGNLDKNQYQWKNLKLDDMCEITSSKRVYKSDYVSEGIPFYKIKEIILKSKNIQPKHIEYISNETFEKFASKFGYPQQNDILLSAVGATIGNFYLVDTDEKFYFKDGNLLWLRNYKVDINKKFLLYLFRTSDFKNKISQFSKGAAQDAITIVNLKSTVIFFPPLELQNKFASIVEKIEKIKEQESKKLQHLETLHKSLMDKAFKGEIQ